MGASKNRQNERAPAFVAGAHGLCTIRALGWCIQTLTWPLLYRDGAPVYLSRVMIVQRRELQAVKGPGNTLPSADRSASDLLDRLVSPLDGLAVPIRACARRAVRWNIFMLLLQSGQSDEQKEEREDPN